MTPPEKPRRLGRGLEALLGATSNAQAPAPEAKSGDAPPPGGDLRRIPIAEIRANPYQPRKEFRPEDLKDLEASIRASGLLQPITVRAAKGGGYELIAGERRFRAVTRLGWTEVPAVVKEVDDTTLLTLALIENLQRADLNAIEEAEGYQRLIDEFGLTQQQVAELVGKDRSTVAQTLRALTLPAAIRKMVQDGSLTLGHARPLLALQTESAMLSIARQTAAEGWSVREVERRVRETGTSSDTSKTQQKQNKPTTPQLPPEAKRIQDSLRRHLQTDVTLELQGADKGELRIRFYNNADLERILDLILTDERSDF